MRVETKSRSIKTQNEIKLGLGRLGRLGQYFRRPCWSADYLRAWFYRVYGGVITVVRCDKCFIIIVNIIIIIIIIIIIFIIINSSAV